MGDRGRRTERQAFALKPEFVNAVDLDLMVAYKTGEVCLYVLARRAT